MAPPSPPIPSCVPACAPEVDAGWFERVWYKDASVLALQLGTFAAGIVLAHVNPWLGTLVMGIAHTTGGWLAHDMVHGRGK